MLPGCCGLKKLLDFLAGFTGLALDDADELVDVSVREPQIVLGQLAPLLLELTSDCVPLPFEHLGVDHGCYLSVMW